MQTPPPVKITNPANNDTIAIGSGSNPLPIAVTIQPPYKPTGAALSYTDGQGTLVQLSQVQAANFYQDAHDPSIWYAGATIGAVGTFTNVKLKVNAHRDSDSNGHPAANSSDTVTGLTISKQR